MVTSHCQRYRLVRFLASTLVVTPIVVSALRGPN